ncbi:gas vesicle protein [Virgibacillus oceani]
MPSVKETIQDKEVGLIDVLDVILDKGVAIKGDLVISIAGVDLVYLDLRVLISSVETLVQSYEENNKEITSEKLDEERRAIENATGKAGKWRD